MTASLADLELQRLRYPEQREAVEHLLAAAATPDPRIVTAVQEMANVIATRGDAALAEFSQRFDGVDLGGRLRVAPDEIDAGVQQVPEEIRQAIDFARRRLVEFHERGKPQSWTWRDGDSVLGQLVRPIRRVGVYAPGGTAAYVSTVLMDVVPAQVAGCPEIVLCSPPKVAFGGQITPSILAACQALGVHEVYRVGGAQAVLALAIGTAQIPAVDMICGPGNAWVTEAKRWAQGTGRVKIDKLAGPTEVLILADDGADPALVAADLLAQAEHDAEARAILVTPHAPLVRATEVALRQQLATLPRREIAEASLRRNGLAVLVPDLKAACEVANAVAPEHLELLVREPGTLVDCLTEAGALFLGPYSPEALGDYTAGPNHVLPTVGQARFASPLQVADFVKSTSLLDIGPRTFAALAGPTTTLARAEGLEGHARSVEIRQMLRDSGRCACDAT